uniref:60S ribosomal protein L22 n=1 Tax=Parascaris univalens TaxID=6257 RepID=A0A915BW01_PARUN
MVRELKSAFHPRMTDSFVVSSRLIQSLRKAPVVCLQEVFLNERIKVNGKIGQMAANGVKIELQKTKLILTSE